MKLYDKIRAAYVCNKLKYEDSWEYTKQYLGLDEQQFQKDVNKLSKKVLKKFDEFILANEELTMFVKRKYPEIRAEYAIFDRMIMFTTEDERGYVDKQFQSLEEVEEYYNNKE